MTTMHENRRKTLHDAGDWIAAKLSRVTSSHVFIPEVDGLRFLALVPVLVLHSTSHFLLWRGWTDFSGNWSAGHGPVLAVLGLGWVGVQIFFVLSGFVVALPFARQAFEGAPSPRLKRYFMRRLTRIEPPYVVALLAMYAHVHHYRALLPDLIAGLFYVHVPAYGSRNPINIVTWSLEVEVGFYLLAPWLTRVYRVGGRSERWMLQLGLIVTWGYAVDRWIDPTGSVRLTQTLPAYLAYFLMGILLADLYASGVLRRSGRWVWDAVAAVSAFAVLYGAAGDWHLHWLLAVLIGGIFIGGMKGRFVNGFLRLRWVTIAGGMCYSAYLWHTAMLLAIRDWLARLVPHGLADGPAALFFCAIAVPILIVLTAPIYYFLEKPFMNGPGSRYLEGKLRAAAGMVRRPVAADVAVR